MFSSAGIIGTSNSIILNCFFVYIKAINESYQWVKFQADLFKLQIQTRPMD